MKKIFAVVLVFAILLSCAMAHADWTDDAIVIKDEETSLAMGDTMLLLFGEDSAEVLLTAAFHYALTKWGLNYVVADATDPFFADDFLTANVPQNLPIGKYTDNLVMVYNCNYVFFTQTSSKEESALVVALIETIIDANDNVTFIPIYSGS